jgi:arylsulfatase A-like enzyme
MSAVALLIVLLSVALAQPLNILYITSDQQRTSTLGCYGNDWAVSPNIDKLAAEGTRFTDAYTVSPVCSPSRTSVLLGAHVPVHGVIENGVTKHRPYLRNYFDVLKEQGYHTALIGKTHFNPVPTESIDHLDAHTGNSDKRGPDVSEYDFLETYLTNQTQEWITSVTEAAPPRPCLRGRLRLPEWFSSDTPLPHHTPSLLSIRKRPLPEPPNHGLPTSR